jgi:hypothetical protein
MVPTGADGFTAFEAGAKVASNRTLRRNAMETSDLSHLARRVTVVTGRGATARPVMVFENRRKGPKTSMIFKGMEKFVRRSMAAQGAYADRYLERHDASNAKKKDGWLTDGFDNVMNASKRAVKVMRKGII